MPEAGVGDLEPHDHRPPARAGLGRCFVTCTATLPFSVNFTALLSRFSSTWRMRVGSPRSAGGSAGSI